MYARKRPLELCVYSEVWFLPVISLLLTYTVSGRGYGLAYPYDWRGFMGAKKKTSVGLLVHHSFVGLVVLLYSVHITPKGYGVKYCGRAQVVISGYVGWGGDEGDMV
jgi:hypothetical protein